MRAPLRWSLAAAAGLAVAVSWLPDDETDAVVQAPVRATGTRLPTPPPLPLPLHSAPPSRAVQAPEAGMAAVASTAADPRSDWPALSGAARRAWLPRPAPAPPAPASAAASEPPPPPAFPYQWFGQMEVEGQTRLFIASPQRVWAVFPGEVLDQKWRIDGVSAGRLQLTWLATGAAVTLAARP